VLTSKDANLIKAHLLGPASDPVAVEFALEAKCYAANHGVGVRETSRLIFRLRHRQFGVLVTTSYLARLRLRPSRLAVLQA